MPHSLMATIKSLGVDSIQIFHSLRKSWLGGFDQQVIMIRHQTVGMANPCVTFTGTVQQIKEDAPIFIILVNILPGIAS
jgi:hypothetical protein